MGDGRWCTITCAFSFVFEFPSGDSTTSLIPFNQPRPYHIMEEHDERTSLVRSNGTSNRVGSPSHNNSNNGYNTGNGHHQQQQNNNNNPARRDPRTLLTQVQQSLGLFQAWAVKLLHENQGSPVVNWVQNSRVARTFMMTINVILAVSFLLCSGLVFSTQPFFCRPTLINPTHYSSLLPMTTIFLLLNYARSLLFS